MPERDPVQLRRTWSRQGLGSSLVGQSASFAAVLVPILGHRLEAVALLVIVSAIGNSGSWLGTWAFTSVYPALRGRAAVAAVATAFWGTCIVMAALLVTAASIGGTSPDAAAVLLASAVFTGSQSAYFVVIGFRVRQHAPARIGEMRLVYGGTNLVLAAVATSPAVPNIGLSLGTSAAFLAAAALSLLLRPRMARLLVAMVRSSPRRAVRRHALDHWRAAFAGLLSNVGLQASAVIALGLVDFRAAWAVVLRISGGYGTVGVSVLGPQVQARVARAVRRADSAAAVAASRDGLLAGAGLALLSMGSVVGVLLLTGVLVPLSQAQIAALGVALAVYVATTTTASPVSVNLLLLGRQNQNLVFNLVRVSVLLPALLLSDPVVVLLLLASVEGGVQVFYVFACLKSSRTIGPGLERGSRLDATQFRV